MPFPIVVLLFYMYLVFSHRWTSHRWVIVGGAGVGDVVGLIYGENIRMDGYKEIGERSVDAHANRQPPTAHDYIKVLLAPSASFLIQVHFSFHSIHT